VTLRICLGMWWRRSWFGLKGTLGFLGSGEVNGRSLRRPAQQHQQSLCAPRWLAAVSIAFAFAYRHGPSRAYSRWEWVSWGDVVAAFGWLLGSMIVSWYIEYIGSFDWLYDSAGAVLGFMLWAWVSSATVLVGTVFNAELERQARPGVVPVPPVSRQANITR
jgi:uncharacterized BrkB/YihY/UPF0761 family membrane protein